MAQHGMCITGMQRRAPFAEPEPVRLCQVRRVMPSAAEVAGNPRSRSAVMRVAERTGVAA